MVTQIENYDQVDVFVGLDVGKGEHHAVALNRAGEKLFDRALPNDERRLRAVLADLQEHGVVLLIVDQPATIGALPIAVAHAAGTLVGYLPGLAMRRIADLHPGESKTDARDALPHRRTPRRLRRPRPRHSKIRVLDPRRVLLTPREQDPQERHAPRRNLLCAVGEQDSRGPDSRSWFSESGVTTSLHQASDRQEQGAGAHVHKSDGQSIDFR